MLQTQTTEKLQNMLLESGQLQAYAFPGGYPIIYYAKDMGDICPECANGGNDAEFQNPEYQDDEQWILVDCDIYFEGPTRFCEHCNTELESAYGDPEEVTPLGDVDLVV